MSRDLNEMRKRVLSPGEENFRESTAAWRVSRRRAEHEVKQVTWQTAAFF